MTDAAVVTVTAHSGPLVLCVDDDEDSDGIRSRSKEDIFHVFQDMPMKKRCPARHYVMELLILATFQMDEKYFTEYKEHLAKVKNIETTSDLIDNFVHNKEEWRRHIPMYVPRAADHANLIRSVHAVVKSDKELSQYYTPELQEYFEKFVNKILRGYFEELDDVVMHVKAGHDKYGLQLFIRKRGTVRAENVHQKMKVAIGPWGIGIRSAHYLLLLLSFRYNVSSNIRRKGYHDFGHCELYLIDRIQTRVREIYNVVIYPLHRNLMEFSPTDLVSIGIGPLSYDADFVEKGQPNPILQGEMKFMAERMGIREPLQPIAHPDEVKMFTNFMMKHPKPTDSHFSELAKQYKQASNGTTIFPKLPSMVKAYYNRWRSNQEIKASRKNLGGPAQDLRQKLFLTNTTAGEFHSDAVLEATRTKETDATVAPAAPMPTQQVAPIVHLHVPPVVAPTQEQHVPVHSARSKYRCAWAPFCKNLRMECGGKTKAQCKYKDSFRNITEEHLQQAKKDMRNEEKRKRKQEQQAEKGRGAEASVN